MEFADTRLEAEAAHNTEVKLFCLEFGPWVYRFKKVLLWFWRFCFEFAFGNCLWELPLGIAFGNCLWELLLGIAYGNWLWELPLGNAFGNCLWDGLWELPLGIAFGNCLWKPYGTRISATIRFIPTGREYQQQSVSSCACNMCRL